MSNKVGDTIRLTSNISDAGEPADPSVLTLTLTTPAGVPTTYTYGVDVELERDDIGEYHLDFVPAEAGLWKYLWSSQAPASTSRRTLQVDALQTEVTFDITEPTPGDGAGVALSVIDPVTGAVKASGVALADGTVTVWVDPGVWEVRASKAGFYIPNQSASVPDLNGGPTTIPVTGMVALGEIVKASTVETCMVFGQVFDAFGKPWAAALVYLETLAAPQRAVVEGTPNQTGVDPVNVFVGRQVTSLRTDKDGFWSASLVTGVRVRLHIPVTAQDVVFQVPAQASLNARDIRPSLGGQEIGIASDHPTSGTVRGAGG